ncbi:MAG: phage holin family protein [Myxococcales bacterium]|jgi:putative membrane protein|nr:phage holin family protein [Myxococcales bacterium]
MTTLLLHWLILTVAVYLAAAIVPGVKVKSFLATFVVAAIFGILNYFIGWALRGVLYVTSLGLLYLLSFLARWIVDALLLKVTDLITDKIEIRGLGPAFLAALVMSAAGTLMQWLLR